MLVTFLADDVENRLKGGIAFAGYAGLAVLGIQRGLTRRFGILLCESGILWQEPLLAPCFIPWNEISTIRTYDHLEQYGGKIQTLGLLARDVNSLKLNGRTKNKLSENYKRFGWHLYFHAESLLVPLDMVESTVVHFLSHPESRGELSNGAAFDRLNVTG